MLLTDEQAGIIHEAVWRECMAHKMEVNEAASVANRALLRLRELGHYPKKTGSGATRETTLPGARYPMLDVEVAQ